MPRRCRRYTLRAMSTPAIRARLRSSCDSG
jgi:hypothetical protein